MKIKITESQLKRVINEVGGYDDTDVMYSHAQSVQAPLLQSLMTTVQILNSFVEMSMEGNLENKQMITNYISNLNDKLNLDIEMINRLINEIYLDADFKDMMFEYRLTLKRVQNYLKMLYTSKPQMGMSFDMTKNELVKAIMGQIEGMEDSINKITRMFEKVHGRYQSRLGIN
jgi:hypothetical protein